MDDLALYAPRGTYHSSLGALLDAYTLVRQHVESVFYPPDDAEKMQTRLRLLTLGGEPVQLAGGRSLAADEGIGPAQFRLVHIPSFITGGPQKLQQHLADAGPVLDWLRRQFEGGARLTASGTGVFYLVAAGLVGVSMTVPVAHLLIDVGRQLYPRLLFDERHAVVEQGRIAMCNGPATDMLLMERIFEHEVSAEMGRWLASAIGTAPQETLLAKDPLVANAQLWLEQRFTQDVKIAELAAAMSTSHQTLIRHFMRALGMRPRDYVQHLRVNAAQRMLEHTNRTIDIVADLVGYRDTASFRMVFRELTGMSAMKYRKSARAGAQTPPPA